MTRKTINGKKAYTTRKEVKRMIRKTQEVKRWDDDETVTPVILSNSGVIRDLTAIPQGVGSLQRIGEGVNPISMEFRLRTTSTGAIEGHIRLIIFAWRQNSFDTLPIPDDILDIGDVIGMVDMTGAKNYRILLDKDIHLGGSDFISQVRKYTVKYKTPIRFNTSGTTGTNKIYSLLYSSSTGSEFGYWFSSRLKYTDS